MKRHHIVFIIFALAILTIVIWLNKAKPSSSVASPVAEKTAISPKQEKRQAKNLQSPTNNENILQSPAHNASEVEKWTWWREISKKDPYFEYKMPISFYGKVVDDEGLPVLGANVEFSWNDLSKEGTSQRNAISVSGGLFSLTGATGKALTVFVSKEGYKHYFSSNQFSFEYAMFADKNYYEPDSMKPVVFVLRKNREAERLEVRENQEAELQPGESKSFTIGPNGATIVVERLPNEDANARTWNAQVSVPSGGLQLTTEEFPFEAPAEGYESGLAITNGIPKPPTWPWGWGAMLYIKTPQGYGRVKVHYTPNMSWVYVDSWFNPSPNSRNLELDPNKSIKMR